MTRLRRPPRLATRLVELMLAPGRSRDGLLGDMEERFQVRAKKSLNRARARYWIEAVASVGRYSAEPIMRAGTWLRSGGLPGLLQDARFAVRSWRRHPGFTALLVGTLTLGVGANSAVFSVVHTLLLQPLPYPAQERLVMADQRDPSSGFRASVAMPNYEDWRTRSTSFDLFAMEKPESFRADAGRGTEVLEGRLVLGDFFDVFGTESVVGSLPSAAELGPGAERFVVLAHGTWMSRFGGDPSAIGQTLRLGDEAYVVKAVLPPGFSIDADVAFYIPMGLGADDEAWTDRDTSYGGWIVARLAPGVDIDAARAELVGVTAQLRDLHGEDVSEPVLFSVREWHMGDAERPLLFLMVGVTLVLLVACANVTGLLLSRAEERRREFAVRATLGAGRWRVARQLLTESAMLGLVAGAVGLLLARLAIPIVLAPLAPTLPPAFSERVQINPTVVWITLAVSILVSILAGIMPAKHAGRTGQAATLRDAGMPPATVRLRGMLVSGQVALSVVLLVCTGLLIASVDNLGRVDPGFDSEDVTVQRIAAPRLRYPSRESAHDIQHEVRDRVQALPGVRTAALSNLYPFSGTNWEMLFREPATWPAERGESVLYTAASPEYFEVFSIELLRGRVFTPADRIDSAPVVVVDESAAARYWPNEDPIGKQVAVDDVLEGDEYVPHWRTVVGVVAHVRNYELAEPSRIEAYVPLAQSPACCRTLWLTVRATGDGSALAAMIRQEVHAVDPEIATYRVSTMQAVVDAETASHRAVRSLFVAFGALALALGSVGIWGIVASTVAQRKREIAVRVALGAAPSSQVVRAAAHNIRWITAGAALGMFASVLAASALKSLLFEVRAFEPVVMLAVVVVLGLTGVGAAGLPALRAAQVDPASALKG